MAETNPEILAARLLAGDLSEAEARRLRERIDADPAARTALARLEGTVTAMKQWRDRQPRHRVLAMTKARSQRRFWLVSLATAAALFLAVGLYLALSSSRARQGVEVRTTSPSFGSPISGPARSDWARNEFAFLLGQRPPQSTHRGSKGGDPMGEGGPGGTPKGTDGGPSIGRPGVPKGGIPGGVTYDQLRRQVDFDFRLPGLLPQGYALDQAIALSRQTLRLTYRADERSLQVYLRSSTGPDMATEALAPFDPSLRTVFTARRGNLAVAMQGGGVDRAYFEMCLKEFVAIPAKP